MSPAAFSEGVSGVACVTIRCQNVVAAIRPDDERAVLCISSFIGSVLKIDAEITGLGTGQMMESLKSKPKFSVLLPETKLVGVPATVEINGPILPALKYDPSTTIRGLVTIDLK